MKSKHRANINVLLSSLIWGLILGLVIWASRWFLTNNRLFNILWRGGNFLALVLYPLLVAVILHRKTRLWVNAFLFSTLGTMLASIGMFLFNAFLNKGWFDCVLGVLGIWLIIQILIPGFEQIPALQREWSLPLWEKLNESSLMEFLFLQFNSIDNATG
jgi:hypothetical protein